MPKKTLLVLLLLVLALFPAGALAAKLTDVWVSGTAANAQTVYGEAWDAVRWWYGSKAGTYYLFLPSCADPSQLTLHFSGPEELQLNGETVYSGQQVSLTPGEKAILKNGKKEYAVEIMQSKGVPAFFIRTESGSLDYIHKRKSNKEPGTLLMVEADGQVTYQGNLTQIKGRGNATFQYYKKSYQIKLENKTDLCGLGKDKTWILLANFHDNSLLRNKITFEMARAAGLQYTPRSAFCDVYLNNEYYGAYELCTKVEVDSGRVNIADLEEATEAVNDQPLTSYSRFGKASSQKGRSKGVNIPADPSDITGGYLVELDYPVRFQLEASGYTTKKGQAIVVKYPEFASKAQMEYISGILQSLENAIRAEDGTDPVTGKHYTEIIDLDSFVRKYLVEEISKNYDGNRSSQFFYKPQDSVSPLLYAGPVWDYDSAYGNYAGSKSKAPATGFGVCSDRGTSYYWFPAAYQQEDFRWKVQEVYAEVYVPILETLLGLREGEGGLTSIDAYASGISSCAAMNFKRWPMFNVEARKIKTGADYAENIQYLKTFLTTRMEFLEKEWVLPYQNGVVAGAQ